MTFAVVLDGLILLAFVVLLGIVLMRDVTSYTIPNTVVLAILGLFVPAYLLHFGATSILSHLLAGLAVLVPGWVMCQLRRFGGGDVKAWAALAVWYGLESLSAMVMAIAVIGGALGIFLLAIRALKPANGASGDGSLARIRRARLLQRGAPVPYGIAIALGALLTANRIPLFADLPLPDPVALLHAAGSSGVLN